MITKTDADIRSEIITALNNNLPNMDLTEGTPERDTFVEAPLTGELSSLWTALTYNQKLFAPITYVNDLDTADVSAYTANFDVVPLSATYSTGVVTFYKNSTPTFDIKIPDGTLVSTVGSSSVTFVVQGTYIMYASIAASYYNATTGRWEISVNVQAQSAGSGFRAGTGTIVQIVGTINGIDGCTNSSPVTGGQPAETMQSAVQRTVDSFQGRGLSSDQGISNYVKNNYSSLVSSVTTVGANDVDMVRDQGLGGAIDIYIIGSTYTTNTDTVTITSTGLLTPTLVNYTNKKVVMTKQPVNQILSLSINSILQPTSVYELVEDTGILNKSTRAYDYLELIGDIYTSTGITSTGTFVAGDKVEIIYLYNSLPITIETDLDSTSNHYTNRDYLLREMTPVTINSYMRIAIVSGQDFTSVSTTAETTEATYIDSILNSGYLYKADVFALIKNIPTVDNIDLTTFTLTPVGGGTVTSQGDIIFGKYEYPVAGTLTFVEWTS